jgi:hypothetical protein
MVTKAVLWLMVTMAVLWLVVTVAGSGRESGTECFGHRHTFSLLVARGVGLVVLELWRSWNVPRA